MSAERLRFQNRRRQSLAATLHLPEGPPRAAVVLAPCYSCTRDIAPIRDAARALEHAGAAALRLDYAGTGESEGRFEDATATTEAEDVADAARLLLARTALSRVHLVGHSLGGGVALRAALELAPAAASVTTIATDPNPGAFARIFGDDVVARAQREGKAVVETGGGKYPLSRALLDDLERLDFLGTAQRLDTLGVPVLHLHGDRDVIVTLREARTGAEAAGRMIEVVRGGDHLFADREVRAGLSERVARFVIEGR